MTEVRLLDVFQHYLNGDFNTVTVVVLLPKEELQALLEKQQRIGTIEKLLDLFLTPYGPLIFGEQRHERNVVYVGMINAIIIYLLNTDNYKDYYWKLLYLGAHDSTILYNLRKKFPVSFTPERVRKALPRFFEHGVTLAMEVSVFTQLKDDHDINLRIPIARFFEGLVYEKLVEGPWLEALLGRVDE